MMDDISYVMLQTPPMPYYLGAGCSTFQIGEQHPHRSGLGIYDLLIVAHGELHMGEDGERWTLTAGETLLLLPEGEHYPLQPCTMETVFYWIHFEHAGVSKLTTSDDTRIHEASRPFSNPHALRIPKHIQLNNPELAYDLIRRLLALPLDSSFWEEQRLFGELLALLESSGAGGTRTEAARLAERAAAYLQLHYKDRITNETLANALHFHPNYIVRCMKSRYDRTPSEYLLEFRLEQARRMLVTTEWSIERIAEEAGFRYAPYFSACFKRSTGLPPLRYRQQFIK